MPTSSASSFLSPRIRILLTLLGAIENGEIAILWLGSAVSPQILQDLYAVENLDELDTRMVRSASPSISLLP